MRKDINDKENWVKQAFFVIGAESSGTRMLTKAFMEAGCEGSDQHFQPMDVQGFLHQPDMIVFRRSLPHAQMWPDVEDIRDMIAVEGYDVEIIGIKRMNFAVIASQTRGNQHAKDKEHALRNIKKANATIDKFADEIVQYEDFVTNPVYRQEFFSKFGLLAPLMYFFNANNRYERASV